MLGTSSVPYLYKWPSNDSKNSDCSLYANDTSVSDTDRELHQAQSKLNDELDTLVICK